ncbi:MAG TPA: MMPL family transporter, partial [Acidimicrobiia bacterium]|nr:MMPL family transporter [Acidimicrobiia bacterium]
VGAISVVGTFLVLRLLASVTDVSIFALNLTTAMSLGLSIDYSLFIVSRYREELRKGREPHDAVVRTVETAGKTVAFSALTVGVALAAMAVFPLVFLRSFAYAGVGVAIMCAVGAVICLPAMLAVLGPRVDSLVLWRHTPKPEGQGAWHRVAMFVMRRPVLVGSAVIALLLVLGAPFFNIVIGIPDDRVLPASAPSHQVQNDIRRSFASREASALQVVAPNLRDSSGTTAKAKITTYAGRLSALPGVARVDASTGSYAGGKQVVGPGTLTARFTSRTADGTWLSVVPTVEPDSPQGEALAQRVRDLTAPSAVLVGGPSARLVDSKASLFSKLPLALGIIAIATFFLLFMMFGGILVPIKALVINVLSLSATFGAIVFVFQEGHLSKLLDFTATGAIAATMPILMFCVAFGLSMDYEVFLLSRIKEEHDRTGDNTASVALGLERTGRIVTGAALLISVVFLAFATSGVMFIKMFGLGLALAVLLDAFVIRATLVPAFMRLAGEANWWAPGPMRRFYLRYGIRESAEPDAFDLAQTPEADPREPASAGS